MPKPSPEATSSLPDALLTAFADHEKANLAVIRALSDEAWQAKPPGGRTRTIAAMVAHVHNVRVAWIEFAKAGKVPRKLDSSTVTRAEAIEGFEATGAALAALLGERLNGGRIAGFGSDAAHFLTYLVAHDAQHRGQILTQGRLAGHPVAKEVAYGIWERYHGK